MFVMVWRMKELAALPVYDTFRAHVTNTQRRVHELSVVNRWSMW